MRGKLPLTLRRHGTAWITPADAGKTNAIPPLDVVVQDHPRGCGENDSPAMLRAFYTGSPPRMRGKRKDCVHFEDATGITPADAGKTLSDVDRDGNKKDHPRGCGENTVRTANLRHRRGSPPRMRGKLLHCKLHLVYGGITPADAGKTDGFSPRTRGVRDHPRGCGENSAWGYIEYAHPGSPPRMRGKLRYNIAKVIQIRITPADAGKTRTSPNPYGCTEDHPRGCGENAAPRYS